MAFQVVHADERYVRRPRRALRERHAHNKRADKPRRICDGHRGKIAPAKRFHPEVFRRDLEAFVTYAADGLDVLAACDLGDDATEARVEVDLACNHVRGKRPFSIDNRRGGLVARGLDRQDKRTRCSRRADCGRLHVVRGVDLQLHARDQPR